jgi:hypothetical protein
MRHLVARESSENAGLTRRFAPALRDKVSDLHTFPHVLANAIGAQQRDIAVPREAQMFRPRSIEKPAALYRFGILSARFDPISSTNTWSARNSITLN